MENNFYQKFNQWDDAKLLEEYTRKSDYQFMALECMRHILIERSLSAEVNRIDESYLASYTEGERNETFRANQAKERHGFTTFWLILIMIVNAGTAILHLVFADKMISLLPYGVSPRIILLLAGIGFFNLICAVALFTWNTWGFYGFILSTAVALIINIAIGVEGVSLFTGFIGLGILYFALHITQKGVSAWHQMN